MSTRELAVGIVLTFLFIGGWMVGAAEGPHLPIRALIAAVMFGGFALLGNLAESRGWLDARPRDPAQNQEVKRALWPKIEDSQGQTTEEFTRTHAEKHARA